MTLTGKRWQDNYLNTDFLDRQTTAATTKNMNPSQIQKFESVWGLSWQERARSSPAQLRQAAPPARETQLVPRSGFTPTHLLSCWENGPVLLKVKPLVCIFQRGKISQGHIFWEQQVGFQVWELSATQNVLDFITQGQPWRGRRGSTAIYSDFSNWCGDKGESCFKAHNL